MSNINLDLKEEIGQDNLDTQEPQNLNFKEKLEEAKFLCESIKNNYKAFDKETSEDLELKLKEIDEKINVSQQGFDKRISDIEKEILDNNESHLSLLSNINKNKEEEINQLTFKLNEEIEKSNNLLIENDKLYRKKIDELNSNRDSIEESVNNERIALRNKMDDELYPLKVKAEEEIKKIELTINQTREDASIALATLKRKYDSEVRQIYRKNAQINDNYNAKVAACKKEFNDEIAKIEDRIDERRQQLMVQIDALKIQYEDEKSKLINQRVEAIAKGDKKEAKELKLKTINVEKFYNSSILSEQKDAEVDFKAIEEQRTLTKANLERKLKQYKEEQQIALENNSHALRVLQYKYECEVQKKNYSKDIVENELSERMFKQENANKLELFGVTVQHDIKDRQLVYALNIATLDYNKANNENYIDYQCFKINQEHHQTKLQLLHDLELRKVLLIYKKNLLNVNRQNDIKVLGLNEKLKFAHLERQLKLIQMEKEKIEAILLASKKVKQKGIEAKLERVKATYNPYISKLEHEFSILEQQYIKYKEEEKLEYQEMVNQINKAHQQELAYLSEKLEKVDSDIKPQFENMINISKNRNKSILEEMNRNHSKIINSYDTKLNEAKQRLEADKNKYLESMIYPVINDTVNYSYQLIEGEYNSALTSYRNLLDNLKSKVESEKIDIQKQSQAQINVINSDYNKNVEQLENEFRTFKSQNESRIREEESIKENRLNEIERNRQSAISDYQIAKNNAQKQYENDIAELEHKLSNMEQEIERSNYQKTQNVIRENSELCKYIDSFEENLKKQLTSSKSILDKNLKNITRN